MSDKEKQQKKQLNIEIGEKESQGIYSNLAIISHSPAEFVIDFTRVMPGTPKARVHARIVMTPQHIKMLSRALNENIARYEQQHGEIEVDNAQPGNYPGFNPDVESKIN